MKNFELQRVVWSRILCPIAIIFHYSSLTQAVILFSVGPQATKKKKAPVQYRSVISDIFDGKILSSVQCLTCERVSATSYLALNIIELTKHKEFSHERSVGLDIKDCLLALVLAGRTSGSWVSVRTLVLQISSSKEMFQDLSLPIPSKDHLHMIHHAGGSPGPAPTGAATAPSSGAVAGHKGGTCGEVALKQGWMTWITDWMKR
jgi:hypothetical protein